jgi:hypothetical protein
MYRLTARDIEAKWGTSVLARYPAEDASDALEQACKQLRAWEGQGWVFLYATLWTDSYFGLRIKTLKPDDWRIKENA